MSIITDALRRRRCRTALLCLLYEEVAGTPDERVSAADVVTRLGVAENEIDSALKYLSRRDWIGTEFHWGRGRGLEIWLTAAGVDTVEKQDLADEPEGRATGRDRYPDFPAVDPSPGHIRIGSGWTTAGDQPGDRVSLMGTDVPAPHLDLSLDALRAGIAVVGSTAAVRREQFLVPLVERALATDLWAVVVIDPNNCMGESLKRIAAADGHEAIQLGVDGTLPTPRTGKAHLERLIESVNVPQVATTRISEFFRRAAIRMAKACIAAQDVNSIEELHQEFTRESGEMRKRLEQVAADKTLDSMVRANAAELTDMPQETLASIASTAARMIRPLLVNDVKTVLTHVGMSQVDVVARLNAGDVLALGGSVGSTAMAAQILFATLAEQAAHLRKAVLVVCASSSGSLTTLVADATNDPRLTICPVFDAPDPVWHGAATTIFFPPATLEDAMDQSRRLLGHFSPSDLIAAPSGTCVAAHFDGERAQPPRRIATATRPATMQ